MVDVKELKTVFNDKLARTGSFDEAFTKAVWIAFNKGIEEERNRITEVIKTNTEAIPPV